MISRYLHPIRKRRETGIGRAVDVMGVILSIKLYQFSIQVLSIPCSRFKCIEKPVICKGLCDEAPLPGMFAVRFIGEHKASLWVGLGREVVATLPDLSQGLLICECPASA